MAYFSYILEFTWMVLKNRSGVCRHEFHFRVRAWAHGQNRAVLDGELARPLGKPRRSWQGRSRVDEAAVGVSVGAWPEPRPAWEDRPLLEKVSAWTKLPARIPARLSPPRPTPSPVWSQYF